MSLGSNVVDRERSLRKFLTRHRDTNFGINCASLARFTSSLCSSIMVPNAPKWKETHENMSLGPNCVDRERPFREILTRLCGRNFCINYTMLAYFAPSFVQKKMVTNAPEREERNQNMSLGSNCVDRERLFREILMRLYGTNFCFNCTRLAHFAPSFVQ